MAKSRVTARVGHAVFHGLSFDEARQMAREESSRAGAASASSSSRMVHGPSLLQSEAVEELQRFGEWFDEVKATDGEVLKTMPPGLKSAARNLIRSRGAKTHPVPVGRCARVAAEIKAAIADAERLAPWPSWEEVSAASDDAGSSKGTTGSNADGVGPVCFSFDEEASTMAQTIGAIDVRLDGQSSRLHEAEQAVFELSQRFVTLEACKQVWDDGRADNAAKQMHELALRNGALGDAASCADAAAGSASGYKQQAQMQALVQTQCNAQEVQIEALAKALDTLKSEMAAMRGLMLVRCCVEETDPMASLDERIAELATKVQHLDGRIGADVQNLDERIIKHATEVQHLGGRIASDVQTLDERIANLVADGQDRVGSIATDVEDLEKRIAGQAADVQNLDRRIATEVQDLVTLVTNVEDLFDRFTKHATEVQDRDERIAAEVQDLDKSIATVVQDLDERIVKHDMEVQYLDGRIAKDVQNHDKRNAKQATKIQILDERIAKEVQDLDDHGKIVQGDVPHIDRGTANLSWADCESSDNEPAVAQGNLHLVAGAHVEANTITNSAATGAWEQSKGSQPTSGLLSTVATAQVEEAITITTSAATSACDQGQKWQPTMGSPSTKGNSYKGLAGKTPLYTASAWEGSQVFPSGAAASEAVEVAAAAAAAARATAIATAAEEGGTTLEKHRRRIAAMDEICSHYETMKACVHAEQQSIVRYGLDDCEDAHARRSCLDCINSLAAVRSLRNSGRRSKKRK